MSIFNTSQWASEHSNHAALRDKRRTRRLVTLAEQMAAGSGSSIARVCNGEDAKLEGAYRLIRYEKVSPAVIRVAGFKHTVQVVKDVPEILALEYTTSLSYKHSVAPELGKLGKATDKSRGWWVHSVLLLDSYSSRALGLIHQEWWCRHNDSTVADENESGKWSDAAYFTRQRLEETIDKVISVCDREADYMSYLTDQQSHNELFVVRAKHSRKLADSTDKLFPYMDSLAVTGGYTVTIPQKGIKDAQGKASNRSARTAKLSIKAG